MVIIERNTYLPALQPQAMSNRPSRNRAVSRSLPMVFVVEDDPILCEVIRVFLETHSFAVECFDSAESFLGDRHSVAEACLLVDIGLGGGGG